MSIAHRKSSVHTCANGLLMLCKESSQQPEPFSTKEVRSAVRTLNNKKAADEFGLSAEHLKNSGNVIIEEITLIKFYNQKLFQKPLKAAL